MVPKGADHFSRLLRSFSAPLMRTRRSQPRPVQYLGGLSATSAGNVPQSLKRACELSMRCQAESELIRGIGVDRERLLASRAVRVVQQRQRHDKPGLPPPPPPRP